MTYGKDSGDGIPYWKKINDAMVKVGRPPKFEPPILEPHLLFIWRSFDALGTCRKDYYMPIPCLDIMEYANTCIDSEFERNAFEYKIRKIDQFYLSKVAEDQKKDK